MPSPIREGAPTLTLICLPRSRFEAALLCYDSTLGQFVTFGSLETAQLMGALSRRIAGN